MKGLLSRRITAPDIVGRGGEIEAVDRFLARLADGPAAVVFEGEPGIGKTTVWRHALERAEGRPFTVLSCRPVEAETKLAFASLADLLEPVAERILPALPDPQRLALDVALMRTSPPGTPPSARAVATAALSALRRLVASAPVVIAIDDEQWLDRASAEALAFALRRLGDDHVGVAATVRIENRGARDPLALERAFAGRIEQRRLGPLGIDGLHHVVRRHLGHAFPRPTLRRIGEAAAGNPFYALEVARALLDTGTHHRPGEPLPVRGAIGDLVVRRLERLPARTRDVLLIASALSVPTIDLVRRAASGEVDAALARARESGVIELQGDRLRFTHPLLASAAYTTTAREERSALHRRLADVVAEPEERARHLALATREPDREVARALDEAAASAVRRGAPNTAGELEEEAVRLTPDDDRELLRDRTIQAAEHFVQAGDRARARSLLERLLDEPIAGDDRARALRLVGRIRGQEDGFAYAIPPLDEALACAVDPALRLTVRLDLAVAIFNAGDLPRALTMESGVVADAERLGDRGLLADALSIAVVAKFIAGRGSDRTSLARARALEDRNRAGQLELRPTSLAGIMAAWEGRLSDGYALLREMCDWAAERGEESGLPFLLLNLSWIDWWRGRFAAAMTWAEEGRVIAEQSGSETMGAVAFVQRGRARVASGDVAGARADLAEARSRLDATGYVQAVPWLLSGEVLLALSLGDVEAAARAADTLVALAQTPETGGLFLDFASDAVEALVLSGQHERAEALLTRFTERARALDRPWAMASAARVRGILASATGDLDGALAAAEEASAGWAFLEMPVELGRSFLVLGQIRRRRGERRLARTALERAGEIFATVGATLWTARTTEELTRIPIRRAAGRELTPTEERVATLAASGQTNAAVARSLFMSPKTVEANLTRIYGKLGIRSRAELGARMVERRSKT